jgi:hypothetical protein
MWEPKEWRLCAEERKTHMDRVHGDHLIEEAMRVGGDPVANDTSPIVANEDASHAILEVLLADEHERLDDRIEHEIGAVYWQAVATATARQVEGDELGTLGKIGLEDTAEQVTGVWEAVQEDDEVTCRTLAELLSRS